jgi:acetyl-CoA carboxylase biotin carboxyl carrier protein
MDLSLLERIVRLMRDNDLNSIELRDGNKRVTLRRGPAEGAIVQTSVASAPVAAAGGKAGESAAAAPGENPEANLHAITSPMVGTFYAATSPDAKPLVVVGSVVDAETDVCIIEAMKVFNNIKAECTGTIARILVTNGQTVEFGQTLFLVKP